MRNVYRCDDSLPTFGCDLRDEKSSIDVLGGIITVEEHQKREGNTITTQTVANVELRH
jgi:hypothetical protein